MRRASCNPICLVRACSAYVAMFLPCRWILPFSVPEDWRLCRARIGINLPWINEALVHNEPVRRMRAYESCLSLPLPGRHTSSKVEPVRQHPTSLALGASADTPVGSRFTISSREPGSFHLHIDPIRNYIVTQKVVVWRNGPRPALFRC